MKPGWTTVTLGDVARITGHIVDPASLPGDTPYVGLEHIEKGGRLLGMSSVAAAGVKSTKVRFTQAHVLFGKLRPNLCKVTTANVAGVASTDILPLLPSDRLDQRYLLQHLRRPSVTAEIAGLTSGANLPRISPKALATVMIPLPPLGEQRRIAAVLDHVDTIRAERRASMAALERMPESVYRSMFVENSDPGWTTAQVVDVVASVKDAMRTGPFGSQLLKEEFTTEGIPVIGIENVVTNSFRWTDRRYISREKYETLKRYTVRPGDVLITIMGTNGRVAVVPESIPTAISTKHLCCITLDHDQCLPDYLRATFLWNPVARQYLAATAKGAIMAGLNMSIIKGLPLSLPPAALQREFAATVAQTDSLRAAAERHLVELDTLFASLQSRAFAGDLDVSKVALFS
ncbi:restriction endonuclease subunit S [Promicromonospora vindobonensis]|uniref:Restriction endonuclease subunit S n=1 Tax=Promicromonospora vindobonensis TaxID=195748 RepID=A0ABW5VSK8_9MICO